MYAYVYRKEWIEKLFRGIPEGVIIKRECCGAGVKKSANGCDY